jgi:hypothetical protein
MNLQYSFTLALLQAAAVYGYANPGACSGACNIHDPTLIQDADGTYYRFSTGGGISYASASSIEGPWTGRGSVLPSGSSIDNSGKNDPWVLISFFHLAEMHLHYLSSRAVYSMITRPLTILRPLMCKKWVTFTTSTTPYRPSRPKSLPLALRPPKPWKRVLGLTGVRLELTPKRVTSTTRSMQTS